MLHVISGLYPGGAEALLYRLTIWPADIEHEVICFGGREWYSPRFEEAGVPLRHLNMRSLPSIAGGLLRLRRLMCDRDPDVVQTWMYRANLIGGCAARSAGYPVVWGIHHSTLEVLPLPSRMLVYLGGLLARWVPDFVINCSSRSAQIHGKLGYAAAPGAVIFNGYDPEVFRPLGEQRSETRKILGISDETFVIGTIGRWHKQKDMPTLLAALAITVDRGVPAKCLLIGRGLGESDAELMQAVRVAGCESSILALGRRSDVPDLARAMDINVLASCGGEAFPNVVAETMLSGTPNVSTDVGDAAMMVGETGWLVPPRDPQKLAEAIERAWREWAQKPEAWQRRRSAARERIADNFTFERMANAYRGVWIKVAEGKRRA